MIHYILFRTQAHTTEDVSRVKQALENVLPPETPIEEEETIGYFNNPIHILSARLEKKAAEKYMDFLRARLPDQDLRDLIEEIPERVSESCDFYLKLSKQDAYLGDVRTSYAEDVIAMRARIAAYPAKREPCIQAMKEYLHAP